MGSNPTLSAIPIKIGKSERFLPGFLPCLQPTVLILVRAAMKFPTYVYCKIDGNLRFSAF